eukprot:1676547-Pyramimonas_sp.AAC.1
MDANLLGGGRGPREGSGLLRRARVGAVRAGQVHQQGRVVRPQPGARVRPVPEGREWSAVGSVGPRPAGAVREDHRLREAMRPDRIADVQG